MIRKEKRNKGHKYGLVFLNDLVLRFNILMFLNYVIFQIIHISKQWSFPLFESYPLHGYHPNGRHGYI